MYERLGGRRRDKRYWLTEKTIEMVEGFATKHGLKKSEAAEYLMLLGLQDTKSIGLAEMISAVVRQEILKQYNRMAKLTVHAGLQAGEAKETARAIYWWIILQEQRAYLSEIEGQQRPSLTDLEARFRVDQKSPEGQQAVSMLQRRQGRYRYQAVKTLRSAIEELHDIMEDLEQWADSYQDPDEALNDAAEDAR